jgi:hypothetical protein
VFVKGQSGNPAGRPKGVPTLTPTLKRVLEEKDEAGLPNHTAIARKLVAMALGGDLEAIKTVFDRIDGKVPQPVEHAGEGGGPLEVVVRYRDETIGHDP